MSPKRFFYSLSGEDFSIIRKSSDPVQTHFAIIGILVGIISVLCFVSFALILTNMIDSITLGLAMAVFFAWMIINLYVLVLYTLSKNVLPAPLSRAAAVAPVIIKYGFILLLALFVAKPLELVFFNSRVEADLDAYKKTYMMNYAQLANERFLNETKQVESIINQQRQLNFDSITLAEKNRELEAFVIQKRGERDAAVRVMQRLISDSTFYTQRIILLCTKHPLSWICTIFIIGLFLAPVTIKHLNIGNEYYQLKMDIETQIVTDAYQEFVKNYNELVQTKYGPTHAWRELYVDPPFNTKRIRIEKKFDSEKNLIDLIYHG